MMKVYLVKQSSGCYDDYSWRIHSIHSNKEAADKIVEDLNETRRKILEDPCPFEGVEDSEGETNYEEMEKLSEEDQHKYLMWSNDKMEARDTHVAEVKEYELDKLPEVCAS